jgi:hypothetical protein
VDSDRIFRDRARRGCVGMVLSGLVKRLFIVSVKRLVRPVVGLCSHVNDVDLRPHVSIAGCAFRSDEVCRLSCARFSLVRLGLSGTA